MRLPPEEEAELRQLGGTDHDVFVEDLAYAWFDATQYIQARLDTLTDDQLRALVAKMQESHTRFHEEVESRALGTIGSRWHAARAKKLGCECYCMWHQCCSENCPPGEHDDESEVPATEATAVGLSPGLENQ